MFSERERDSLQGHSDSLLGRQRCRQDQHEQDCPIWSHGNLRKETRRKSCQCGKSKAQPLFEYQTILVFKQ